MAKSSWIAVTLEDGRTVARPRGRMDRLGLDIHQDHAGFYARCSCGWRSRSHETYHSACCAKAAHRCSREAYAARIDQKIGG